MYKINDMVVYGNEGVCKITDLTKRSFANKVVEYYVLKLYIMNIQLYIYLLIMKNWYLRSREFFRLKIFMN